ncbi:hypothetical protein R6Y99_05395 [Pseudomonas lundensis]|uniref:hypothetical protein n=1 Tax=Serratia proteamaculans TaxID=28151 RepID=UPI002981C4C3|nr:hypothetical protein [Serratia proteamaculans]MDW5499224.1 hypothetical protein [Serratia proteamaculans]MDW5504286.1 hypothetical protein [Pseudomonas lundensis]
MKLKIQKRLSTSAIKYQPGNTYTIQLVRQRNRLLRHKPGIISKLASVAFNNRVSTSSVKIKRTPIQWMVRYAWHGVFIISGLFWLAVVGFIWFLASL